MIYLHVLETTSYRVQSPLDALENQTKPNANANLKKQNIKMSFDHEKIENSVDNAIEAFPDRPKNKYNSYKKYNAIDPNKKNGFNTKNTKPSFVIPGAFAYNGVNERVTQANYHTPSENISYRGKNRNVNFNVSPITLSKYRSILINKNIPSSQYNNCEKWLKFFHHFCRKYGFAIDCNNSIIPFIEKLKTKNISFKNIEIAKSAVDLFFLSVNIN